MILPLRSTVAVAAALAAAPLAATLGQTTGAAPTIVSAVPATPNERFPLPPGLAPQVAFWKRIYSEVSKDEVLLHDRNRLDVIYEELDVPEARTASAEVRNRNVLEAARTHTSAILRALAAGFDPDTLSDDAERILEAWGPGTPASAFAEAADNVRWQRGLRERFAEGIAYSGRYQTHVEQVFREEGVPLELTHLPFVESMYDVRAYSSVGAAGVWQFMPGTGRLFLRVDSTVDERLDPIRAARAAARLLRQNYESLGTWPLAVTAYNHGPYGMKNAVRTMGTRDIERIVKGYTGRGFGFASRNFYTEFLAALEVRRNFAEHFDDVEPDPALTFEEVRLPAAARTSTLARALALPVEALWDLNPSLTPRARREDRALPAGHVVRLPAGSGARWGAALASLRAEPAPPRPAGGASPGTHYVVRRGDTLSTIASRHDVSLTELRAVNGLGGRSLIRPGQRLKIPR
ncbi:MAG TPA: transglycosylase SLT domain-containing protein [Gemmatimonadota bacterium]